MSTLENTILVVEDDDLLRNILIDQLGASYTIIAAKNGSQALQQLEFHRPKLMVLDLLLPEVDGFQVLERLRTMRDDALARIPVVVVSNLTDDASISRARQYGVAEYFAKAEIGIDEIVRCVGQLVKTGGYRAAES